MLERARALQRDLARTNVTWKLGDVLPLPFTDGAFTLVLASYAFHHFPDPAAVLAEMTRVCAPGGTVMVVDTQASSDPVKADSATLRIPALCPWPNTARCSAARDCANRV